MYDVVIIGGNISGCSAAIQAAKKGVKVALIEKHKNPFYPAHCGEAIADVTSSFLQIDKMNCSKNIINKVIVNVSSNSNKYVFNLSRNKIHIIDRTCLEKELIKESERNGAKLYLEKRMIKHNPPNEIILDSNKKVNGKIIIDASGIKCIVGREIGLNTSIKPEDIGVCIQSRIKGDFDANAMHMWFNEPYAPFGYAWFFPKSNDTANVGSVIREGQKKDKEKLLKKYIEYMTKGNYEIIHTFRSCEPLTKPMETLVKNNVIIVGDAARLVDPASGAGIHNAAFSGKLAGIISAKYILGEIPSLDIYQDLLGKKIKRITKTYKRIKKLDSIEKFSKGFNRAFSTIETLNKIFPNFFQGSAAKKLEKDEKIINSLN